MNWVMESLSFMIKIYDQLTEIGSVDRHHIKLKTRQFSTNRNWLVFYSEIIYLSLKEIQTCYFMILHKQADYDTLPIVNKSVTT
jgi:hypothetical protein